jgi:nitronate monooxygenase
MQQYCFCFIRKMASNILKSSVQALQSQYPWIKTPLIIQAPMRVLAGPKLAATVSEAGGIGFIGPGEKPEHLQNYFEEASELISRSTTLSSKNLGVLPLGFGIQTWAGDLNITTGILKKWADSTPPAIAWLFAPRHGQHEIDEWAHEIRSISPRTKIWIQVASVKDAIAAASSSDAPDVLVVQGSDAGGHSLSQGAGIITLFPEVTDALASIGSLIPLIAAGGILDSRGASAALALGASGTALGTRFLCTPEANIKTGYQEAILSATDGGQTTVRTQLYNHLRGTTNWPAGFDARAIVNASWRDHLAGVEFEDLKKLHAEALEKGHAFGSDQGRTATYAGTGIGLVRDIRPAAEIVDEVRKGADKVWKAVYE